MAAPGPLLTQGDAHRPTENPARLYAGPLEVFYPYQRLLEEGYEVHIAAPSKKKLQFVVHDFVEGFDTYTEKPGHSWPADLAFSEVDPSQYVALVIPGGRAPEYIRNDPDVQRITQHFFAEEKPVAHLCHGGSCPLPPACCPAGVPRPIPPWHPRSGPPTRSSSTVRPWWTV